MPVRPACARPAPHGPYSLPPGCCPVLCPVPSCHAPPAVCKFRMPPTNGYRGPQENTKHTVMPLHSDTQATGTMDCWSGRSDQCCLTNKALAAQRGSDTLLLLLPEP